MKTTIFKSETRGSANYGWLKTRYSFSFGEYYDAERIHYGVLRVLNDDEVAAGQGFGMHPHDNMEIITIPLEGKLQHRDNMGNSSVIEKGEIQVMSAGTGIFHSEFNPDSEKPVKLLQIWLFPDKKNHSPRYQQQKLDFESMRNRLHLILTPQPSDTTVYIHQNAWFSMALTTSKQMWDYNLYKPGNGVYIFVIEGSLNIGSISLNRRDGIGLSDLESVTMEAEKDSMILLMEFPMHG
ncbi:MAG TPA: pirin family protein [Bacteroidales bacterium]|nr:pirin family protein [Bacteroidales bacterium]